MSRLVLIEEVHLTFLVPGDVDPRAARAIRRKLGRRSLAVCLRRCVARALKCLPRAQLVRVRVNR